MYIIIKIGFFLTLVELKVILNYKVPKNNILSHSKCVVLTNIEKNPKLEPLCIIKSDLPTISIG